MCPWFILLAVAQLPALITSESNNKTSSSLTSDPDKRVLALQCHLDVPNCACAMGPAGPGPQPTPYPCLWDANTCECGWDVDNTGIFVGVGPPVPATKTCVIDTQNCKCLAGSLPLAPSPAETPTPSIQEVLDRTKVHINVVEAQLEEFHLSLTQGVTETPIVGVGPLTTAQREQLTAEVVAVMTLLRDAAAKVVATQSLVGGARKAMVERLREEVAYLRKIRDDPAFMAAQLGSGEVGKGRPIVERLRKVLAELETASRRTTV